MRQKQEAIAALINASKTRISPPTIVITTYPKLLETGLAIEFENGIWELDNWVNAFGFCEEDVFKDAFLRLCALRDDYTANSRLSYSGLPNGLCNTLFWEVSRLLFPTNDLISQIKCLIPSVTHVLEFYYEMPKTIQLRYKIIPLEQSQVADADLSSPSVLKNYAIAGALLFDMRELMSLPFALHLQWYKLLGQNQQDLLSSIVQHNDFLRKLHADLQLINQGGLTPRDAITHLMLELKRSGERLSGEEFALAPAPIALVVFFEYLDSLPETLQIEVLALLCPGNKLLADILEDLQNDKCVQTAADELLSILDNKANAKTLAIKPHLTEEQVNVVYKRYTKGKKIVSLNVSATGGYGLLPHGLRRQVYDKLQFDDIYELVDFLQVTPVEDYSLILNTNHMIHLCNSESNTEEIGYYVDVLNAEQIEALFVCLVKYSIVDDSKIVSFIQKSNHLTVLKLLPKVLIQYREHQLVQFLTVNIYTEVGTLLEWLENTGDPEHLEALQAILLLFLEKSAKGEVEMHAINLNKIFRRLANNAWSVLEAIYNNTPHKNLLCDELLTLRSTLGTPMFNLIKKTRYQTNDPASLHRFILTMVNTISANQLAHFLANEAFVMELILGCTYPHNIRLIKVFFEKLSSYQLVNLLMSDCLNIGSEKKFQDNLLHFVFTYTPYRTLADELLKYLFKQLQPAFLFKLLHEKLAPNKEETTLSTLLDYIECDGNKNTHYAWEYMSIIFQNLIQKPDLLSKIVHCSYQSKTVLFYLIAQIEAKSIPISLETMQFVLKHLPENPCHNVVDDILDFGNKKMIKTLWSLEQAHPVIAQRHQQQLEKDSRKTQYGVFFAGALEQDEPNKKRKIEGSFTP